MTPPPARTPRRAGAALAKPKRKAPDPPAPRPAAGLDPGTLRYDERGLLPVVVQEVGTGALLMLAWADREAVERTLATGEVHFHSRARRRLWRKGETSGNVLTVSEILADCDGDTLLVRARAAGPACHRGTRTCFEPNPAALELGWLAAIIDSRREADPTASYTARLLAAGIERAAQKVGEEGVEVALSAVALATAGSGNTARRSALVSEAADLLYHLLVLLAATGVAPEEVARELQGRAGQGAHRSSDPRGKPR